MANRDPVERWIAVHLHRGLPFAVVGWLLLTLALPVSGQPLRVKSRAASVLSPGVYVNEGPLSARGMDSVPMHGVVVIGYTERRPVPEKSGVSARPVTSLVEYKAQFGERAPSLANKRKGTTDTAFYTYDAVRLFFANGGRSCLVVSIGDYSKAKQAADFVRGLAYLDRKNAGDWTGKYGQLIMPDVVDLPQVKTLQELALSFCAESGRYFFILDVPLKGNREDSIKAFRESMDPVDSLGRSFGAAYAPWLVIGDGESDGLRTVPPSGAVAGVYAATDSRRGVHKAPAGLGILNVLDLTDHLDRQAMGEMLSQSDRRPSINPIVMQSGRGVVVMGGRTLCDPTDYEFRYINVRRQLIVIENSISDSCTWTYFEPNDNHTWRRLSEWVESYLRSLWQSGALFGVSPEEAYFVRVGKGKSKTQDDIDNGVLRMEVGVSLVRPAEFVIMRFRFPAQVP